MSTVGYSNNKRCFSHGTHDIPHMHHVPHGTEHPPRYCTHVIQGEKLREVSVSSFFFRAVNYAAARKILMNKYCTKAS